MANYDEKQEEKKRLARETQVDEDGFTKVISGITKTPDGLTIRGAPRPAMKIGAFAEAMTSRGNAAPSKKKKKQKEMPDFYRFQMREKRREEIIDHRKRNAKDMDTVKQMKKAGHSSRFSQSLCRCSSIQIHRQPRPSDLVWQPLSKPCEKDMGAFLLFRLFVHSACWFPTVRSCSFGVETGLH